MKSSLGITTDVNICFINYEMIKTHMIKTNWVWIKITFIKWMHIICPIYHVLETALFWDVSPSFWFFLLIINRESRGVVFVLTNEKRLGTKSIKFTHKSTANLWIHLDRAKVHHLKELTSPCYIISYLHILNLNWIFWLLSHFRHPVKVGLVWHELWSPCFLPARFTCMCASSLQYQNKCKLSIRHKGSLMPYS